MDIQSQLMDFGLTRQEATLYLALVHEGKMTGYEASKISGISKSNTYKALAGLVDKGASYIEEDTATRYLAVPIEEFCNNKIRYLKDRSELLKKAMPQQRIEEIGYITIKGRNAICDKLRNMIGLANQRLYISASSGSIKHLKVELSEALSKGLKVVIITDDKSIEKYLEGATFYYVDKSDKEIRLIIDSSKVITGELSNEYSTCLYSGKSNLVSLFKDALKNEITLIKMTGKSN